MKDMVVCQSWSRIPGGDPRTSGLVTGLSAANFRNKANQGSEDKFSIYSDVVPVDVLCSNTREKKMFLTLKLSLNFYQTGLL